MSKTPANYNTLYVNVTQVPITCSCGFVLWSFEKYGLEFGEKGFFFLPAFGVQWKLDLEGISSKSS